MAKHFKVKQIRSAAGRLPRHILTIKGLGLRGPGSEVELADTPQIRGMISSVHYLLEVVPVEERAQKEAHPETRDAPRITPRKRRRQAPPKSVRLEKRETYAESNQSAQRAPIVNRSALAAVNRADTVRLPRVAAKAKRRAKVTPSHASVSKAARAQCTAALLQRGFKKFFRKEFAVINVSDLEQHFESGDVVDAKTLHDRGIVKVQLAGVKVLGDGELKKKLTLKLAAYSAQAKTKIENAGGTVEVVAPPNPNAAAA